MTARDLQTAIMEDLDQLFKDSLYKTPEHTLAALKTHRQRINQRDAQDTEDPFPYIIVRLDSGGIDAVTDPHKVNVLLLIGIYDDALGDYRDPPPEDGGWDTRNFGDLAVLEIIERIQAHYEKQPHLEGGPSPLTAPSIGYSRSKEATPTTTAAANSPLPWQRPAWKGASTHEQKRLRRPHH